MSGFHDISKAVLQYRRTWDTRETFVRDLRREFYVRYSYW